MLRLAFVIVGIMCAPCAQGLTIDDVEQNTSLWPRWVSLTDDAIGIDGVPKRARAGIRYALIRIEDSKLIVDGGRVGVFTVAPEWTNVLAGARALHEGREQKTTPILLGQLSDKLFMDAGDIFVRTTTHEFLGRKRMLIIYVPAFDLVTPALVERLGAFQEAHATGDDADVLLVMIQRYPEHAEIFERYTVTWPVMVQHFAEGYTKSMHHQPARDRVTAVLTDAEGKILAHSERLGGGQEAVEAVLTQAGKEQ